MQLPAGFKTKEEYVHHIFSSIARRYDLMNTLLSLNRDKKWRDFAARETGVAPGGCGLDVCCGTGMLALALARRVGVGGRVVGLDFNAAMLEEARKNLAQSPHGRLVELVRGNAMSLPYPDGSFDCATIGFALRNVPDIPQVLKEMARVVRPGGRVVSLELAKPHLPVFKQVYYLYFDHLVPLLGRLGIGQGGPYAYLPNSLKEFPPQEEVRLLFEQAGLANARYTELTGGVVAVHVGVRA